jgi:hypothetical protein
MKSTVHAPSTFETLPILDVDSHITEPPDLWTARMSNRKALEESLLLVDSEV